MNPTNTDTYFECYSHGSSTPPDSPPLSPRTPTENRTSAVATPILQNNTNDLNQPSIQPTNSISNVPLLSIGSAPQTHVLRESTFSWNGKLYKISQNVSVDLTAEAWEARVGACKQILGSLDTNSSQEAQQLKAETQFQLFLTQDRGAVAVLNSANSQSVTEYAIPNTHKITSEILLAEQDPSAEQHLIQTYIFNREKIPSTDSLGNVRFIGGDNICYLNAAAQVLFSDPTVRDAFRKTITDRQNDDGPYTFANPALTKALDKEVEKVLEKYEEAIKGSKPVYIDLRNLRQNMVAIFGDMTGGEHGQEDPDAAYLSLLRLLEGTDVGLATIPFFRTWGYETNGNPFSKKLFGKELTFDRTTAVHLDLKMPQNVDNQMVTIQYCISTHLDDGSIVRSAETTEIEADPQFSQQTGNERFLPTGQVTYYSTPPEELFLHLNRNEFISNNNNGSYYKKNTRSILLTPEIEIPEQHIKSSKELNQYVLLSFSRHIGTALGGHCIAYTRQITGIDSSTGKFIARYRCHDDANCREITEHEFLAASLQGGISKYKRKDLVVQEFLHSEDEPDLRLNPDPSKNDPGLSRQFNMSHELSLASIEEIDDEEPLGQMTSVSQPQPHPQSQPQPVASSTPQSQPRSGATGSSPTSATPDSTPLTTQPKKIVIRFVDDSNPRSLNETITTSSTTANNSLNLSVNGLLTSINEDSTDRDFFYVRPHGSNLSRTVRKALNELERDPSLKNTQDEIVEFDVGNDQSPTTQQSIRDGIKLYLQTNPYVRRFEIDPSNPLRLKIKKLPNVEVSSIEDED